MGQFAGNFGRGQSVRRVEDQRFLTGTGRYTDDISVPGQAYLYLLRSTHAHADLKTVDVSAAKAAPGVLAVLTSAELAELKVGNMPVEAVPPAADGRPPKPPVRPVLAKGRVRYVGEPIVAVIAETLAQAKDAAELVEIDYAELPVSANTREAVKKGAFEIHAEAPGNVLVHWSLGDAKAVDEAFTKAFKIIKIDLINNRMHPTALEPRAAIGEYDAVSGRYTLTNGCQNVHKIREWIVKWKVLDVTAEQIRVVCPDVGGGFGMRYFLFNEPVVCLAAAKLLGRPVKWTADRSESFLADGHGRDQVNHAELAVAKDGTFLGIRVSSLGSVGAYVSPFGAFIPTMAGSGMLCGTYRIPAAAADVRVVMSNTAPVDAYRGAGRPEAAYVVERIVEQAARELGIAATELRRKNFIRPEEFPYKTPLGPVYDTGRYAELMDAALKRADYAGMAARKAEARKKGMLRGAGVSYYVEACAGGSGEKPILKFAQDGHLTMIIGTQSNGQGHETVYAQLAAAAFGIPLAQITVKQGDTDLIPTGNGTGGSRSVPVGGSALQQNALKMIEQGKLLAGEVLEAAAGDIEFAEGAFTIAGTDRSVALKDVVKASFERKVEGVQPGLYVSEDYSPAGTTFPNGCHVCEIDIEEDTGVIHFVNYTVQDDLGHTMNPLLATGQIVGGAVQGIGQALYEEAVYDATGQLVTGSFMDYCMPRADSTPAIDVAYTEVPTPRNTLGLKGAGEAGTIGATPATVNAVLDALAPLGITHLDMPLTPLKIWQAIHAAKTHAAE